MNRPNRLIKELRDFNACEYGNELSRRQCHEIVDYIDSLEKALDKACDRLAFVCEHKSTCSNCSLSVCPMVIFEISAWEYLKDKKKWMKEWCLKDA